MASINDLGDDRWVTSSFRDLVERCLEPALVLAGFAPGQWTVGETSVTYCADPAVYVRRHPHLVNGDHWANAHCIDITIDHGATGIARFEVEFESLAELLGRVGFDDDARALPSILELHRPDRDAQRLGETLTRLYGAPGTAPPTG